MIRFATNNDIIGIIRLWQEAFGDSEKEIKFFLDNKFKPQNTLVFEESNHIVSMLFLLDGKMCIKGIDYPAYYLYAACTAQSHRGRGIMSDLLKAAEKSAFERNIDFICLLPAEDSLYDYYARFGYQAVFSEKLLSIKRNETSMQSEFSFNIATSAGLEMLRDYAYNDTDCFKWDDTAISFAFDHCKMYGGYSALARNGYALYSIIDSKIHVKEYAFTHGELQFFTNYLFKKHDIEEIIITLPYNFETDIGKSTVQKSGMMLPIRKEVKHLANDVKNAYLGLTLD